MKIIILSLLLLLPVSLLANSSPYHQLIELTAGKIWTQHDQFYELGLDYEYFPRKFDHHLSFGIATELEFEEENEFFVGPLVSIYYHLVKYFLTTGLQGHDSYWRLKTRMGIGYEFYIKQNLILVPNLTADYIDQEIHPGISLGLAHEF